MLIYLTMCTYCDFFTTIDCCCDLVSKNVTAQWCLLRTKKLATQEIYIEPSFTTIITNVKETKIR